MGFFSLYQNLISTTFGCNIIGDYLPEVTGCGGYLPNGDGAGLLGRRRVRVGEHVTAAVTAAATELGTYDDLEVGDVEAVGTLEPALPVVPVPGKEVAAGDLLALELALLRGLDLDAVAVVVQVRAQDVRVLGLTRGLGERLAGERELVKYKA